MSVLHSHDCSIISFDKYQVRKDRSYNWSLWFFFQPIFSFLKKSNKVTAFTEFTIHVSKKDKNYEVKKTNNPSQDLKETRN